MPTILFKADRFLKSDGSLAFTPGEYEQVEGSVFSTLLNKQVRLDELFAKRGAKPTVENIENPQSWTPITFEVNKNHIDVFDKLYWRGRVIPPDSYEVLDGEDIMVGSQKVPICEISESSHFDVEFRSIDGVLDFYYVRKIPGKITIYDHDGKPHVQVKTNSKSKEQKEDISEHEIRVIQSESKSASEQAVVKQDISTSNQVEHEVPSTKEEFPVLDPINPDYYKRLPFEVIDITETLDFCSGNAVKYLMRAGYKPGNDKKQDLKKAIWYLERELTLETPSRIGILPICAEDVALHFTFCIGTAIYHILTSSSSKKASITEAIKWVNNELSLC